MDMLRDITESGVVGDATRASVETGERVVAAIVPRIVQVCKEMAGKKRPCESSTCHSRSRGSRSCTRFSSTQILRHIQHSDAPEGRPSFNAELIITSNHAATHVDAFGHYQKGGAAIAEMPLETFCGDALCLDIRQYPGGHDVTAAEVAQAVAESGHELRDGDILLFCSDHYNRTAGTPAFLDGFNGISAESVHWMADRGVKICGVETISPDLVYLTDEYPTHKACASAGSLTTRT